MKDTARVLGRTFDGIEYRGFSQETVEILAQYAGVPVWNGLTDEFHPTQILADILTMTEHSDKHLTEIAYCYLGDARNNMGNSLMVGGCKLGMDVRLCAPEHLWPARRPGEGLPGDRRGDRRAPDPHRGRRRGRERRRLPLHRRVGLDGRGRRASGRSGSSCSSPTRSTRTSVRAPGNPNVKFLHCLPAFHNRETKVGEEIFQTVRPRWAGGHRRRVRVRALDRLRPGREPPAHDQGRHGRHPRRLSGGSRCESWSRSGATLC